MDTSHVITLPGKLVTALLDHSEKCTEHAPTWDQIYNPAFRKDGKAPKEGVFPNVDDVDKNRIPWGLIIVADQGVYAMSNGEPRLLDRDNESRSKIVFAEGINADTDDFDDWWAAKRRVCGGDDQSFFLDGETAKRAIASTGNLKLEIWNNGLYITSYSVVSSLSTEVQ